MDNLYYAFNEFKLCSGDFTKGEIESLVGVEVGAIVGFRRELFKVSSVNPLELVLVKNAAI